jgi:hypothetical protein
MHSPIIDIFLRPTISASLPKGTMRTAVVNVGKAVTQVKRTALTLNPLPITGNATLSPEITMDREKNNIEEATNISVLLVEAGFALVSSINRHFPHPDPPH